MPESGIELFESQGYISTYSNEQINTMEYNNYYSVQPGQSPPPSNMMNSQPDCSIMGTHIMAPNGPPMMQPSPAPSTPLSMRQTPGPPPMQPQQHLGPGPQMHQQPSPHPVYHQLPQHPPISHSASPHPSSTPHAQQPPPRPSTGPSPLHHQSPIHMNGPSPKLQQQTPGVIGPPPMHGQPMHGQPINHHPSHNFGGSPMPHHYYHQQNQPPPPPMHHHGRLPPGVRGGGSMPPPPGYMMSPPMHHHQHHHAVGPPPPPIERGSPFYQQIPQTEFRIIEFNKRLQNRPRPMGHIRTLPIDELDESRWWKQFACDFFDDEATLMLRIPGEDKPTEYAIGRAMIPRFFKSYFDGGVMDFCIKLRNIRESAHHPGFITLDCDQTDITTKNFFRYQSSSHPLSVVVHTEGHLSIDFVSSSFDNLLIKSWRFYAHQCHEYVDRSMTAVGAANAYLAEPVTRFGLTKRTCSFLKMCTIMEPMQDLMIQHRQTNMKPRACLKHLLYERLKLKPEDSPAQPNKRRRRKTAANGGPATTKKTKASSNGANAINSNPLGLGHPMMQSGDVGGGMVPNLPLGSQDVLVVGEPSMLGADFGDENERRITRLENDQFDPTTSIDTLSDNNNHLLSQQIPEVGGPAGQQVENNLLGQNNLINQQQPLQQQPQPQQQQQLQQQQQPQQQQQQNQQLQQQQQKQQQQQQPQQPTVSNNDPLNPTIPDDDQQNSYQEASVEGEVASILNFNAQCNSDEQHGIKLEASLDSQEQAVPTNCNNNNHSPSLINETVTTKQEIDLEQQQQQQQQQQPPMTTTGPTPKTEP